MLLLNNEPIDRFNFPNHETGIKLPDFWRNNNVVTLFYESDQDLIDLMLLRRHYDQIRNLYFLDEIRLIITYMPYSRMDRANDNYIFSLKHVCDFINWLNFDEISIVEPHSDVTCALINRSRPIHIVEMMLGEVLETIGFNNETDYLVFPDAGAQKRYENLGNYNQLVGIKERDFKTGNIIAYHMVCIEGAGLFRGRKAVIIDDLCSGGRTFIEATKELKGPEYFFDEVHLLVAHCEENVYNGELFDYITSLHASTSLQSESRVNRLKLYDIRELISRWQ